MAEAKKEKEIEQDSPEHYSPIINGQKIVTYSNSITITLTNYCHNKCKYCDFPHSGEPLTVPYHTIQCFKQARFRKAREVNIVSGERPDTINLVRAKLGTWGFNTFSDYIYTICELAFLEGLLPHLNVGYLTPKELKQLREISVSMEMNLETTNKSLSESIHKNSPGKDPKVRMTFLENCGKLEIPTTTGIRVGMGENKADRVESLKFIKSLHEQHGHIKDVVLHNFIPKKQYANSMNEVSKKMMLDTVKLAKDILPADVKLRVPIILNPDIVDFINAGVDDLGQIQPGEESKLFPGKVYPEINQIKNLLEENGYILDKRLPIYNDLIIKQKYSKKLAQLLDKYRYKLNLIIQEQEAAAS